MAKQENCPVCGQLMETFKTESGREVHTCEGSQVGRRHLAVVLFYADPALPEATPGPACAEATVGEPDEEKRADPPADATA